jgi:hypothetical protein
MAIIGNSSFEHTLHNTNEIRENVGFVHSATGAMELQLRDDSAATTFYVNAGQFYPFDVKIALATGSTAGTFVVITGEKRG